MKHKCRPGSPAAILMGSHRKHHDAGGEAMMPAVGARRAAPNLDQRFKKGGRAAGGAMEYEDALKSVGAYSAKGGEMEKEDRHRARGGAMSVEIGISRNPMKRNKPAGKKCYATGGEIGVNTGSSIARRPGDDAIGDGQMRRAMGGAAKTRKGYPMT